jgi:hypothetical protein
MILVWMCSQYDIIGFDTQHRHIFVHLQAWWAVISKTEFLSKEFLCNKYMEFLFVNFLLCCVGMIVCGTEVNMGLLLYIKCAYFSGILKLIDMSFKVFYTFSIIIMI